MRSLLAIFVAIVGLALSLTIVSATPRSSSPLFYAYSGSVPISDESFSPVTLAGSGDVTRPDIVYTIPRYGNANNIGVFNATSGLTLPVIDYKSGGAAFGWPSNMEVDFIKSMGNYLVLRDPKNNGLIVIDPVTGTWLNAFKIPTNYYLSAFAVDPVNQRALAYVNTPNGQFLSLYSLIDGSTVASVPFDYGTEIQYQPIAWDFNTGHYFSLRILNTDYTILEYDGNDLTLLRALALNLEFQQNLQFADLFVVDTFSTLMITRPFNDSGLCLYYMETAEIELVPTPSRPLNAPGSTVIMINQNILSIQSPALYEFAIQEFKPINQAVIRSPIGTKKSALTIGKRHFRG